MSERRKMVQLCPPNLPVSDISRRWLQTGTKVNGSCYQLHCGYNQKLSERQMRGSLWVVCVAGEGGFARTVSVLHKRTEKQMDPRWNTDVRTHMFLFPIIPNKIIVQLSHFHGEWTWIFLRYSCLHAPVCIFTEEIPLLFSLCPLQICYDVAPAAYLVGTLFWLLHENVLQAVLSVANAWEAGRR